MADLLALIRQNALTYAGLTSLLGGADPNAFRWWDTRLKQKSPFPAVVQTLVSDSTTYSLTRRLGTSFARVQFEIWGYDPASDITSVEDALSAFLDQLNLYGVTGLQQNANYILNRFQRLYADTQPPQYQRVIDTKIFWNSTL